MPWSLDAAATPSLRHCARSRLASDLVVDARQGQLRLDDHGDDAEHGEYQRVVGDSLALFVEDFSSSELVAGRGAAAAGAAAAGPA